MINYDATRYYELGLNELGMDEAEVKRYRARVAGTGHEGDPPTDPSKLVMVRICYNPITGNYTTEDQKEMLWETDENGYALLDCDYLPEPRPDQLVLYGDDAPPAKKLPPKASEADKKRKTTKPMRKKKKKTKATNLEEPTDNTSSPTRSETIETLAEKNLDTLMDPSASTAPGTRFQPHMNQILLVISRCNHCGPLLDGLVTSGSKPEADG